VPLALQGQLVIVFQPRYSFDLAPFDFVLFHKLKMELKGRSRKNDGIAVYIPKETILKEMVAKIKLNQHFFFDLIQEFSDKTLEVPAFLLSEKLLVSSLFNTR
jgi:hypothetical protein